MATSKYFQLNNYILLEYNFESEEISTSNLEIQRIKNNIYNEYQFVNGTSLTYKTNNIVDTSASVFDKSINRWVYHNTDDANLINTEFYTLEDITGVLDVRYDKIKLHILSGYSFDLLDGFIFSTKFKENSEPNFLNATNFVFLKSDYEMINFSKTPLFLGERFYDRFIELQIPSLSSIQSEYWAVAGLSESIQSHTFAYNYTHPNNQNTIPAGFVKDSQIYFEFREIESSEIIEDVTYFNVSDKIELSINDSDSYSNLSAVLRLSESGDYYEYFATWNGEFVDDYINLLNTTTSGDWNLIHQIDVYEQIGTSEFLTSNFTSIQSMNFDKANLFRPIIINSDIAYAFHIDYTLRLFNKVSTEQIIRKSSLTSTEPKQFGKDLKKIKIDSGFKPLKVYNKIIENKIQQTNEEKIIESVKVERDYINVKDIKVNINGGDKVLITRFTNKLKFNIFNETETTKEFVDLSMERLFLQFDDDRFNIEASFDSFLNPQMGEVLFIITEKISRQLIELPISKRNFYIISENASTLEKSVIYHGKFKTVEETEIDFVKVEENEQVDQQNSLK